MSKTFRIGSTHYTIHPEFEAQAMEFMKNKNDCRLIGTQLADDETLRIWWMEKGGKLDCILEPLIKQT